jgi:hypothetical protein
LEQAKFRFGIPKTMELVGQKEDTFYTHRMRGHLPDGARDKLISALEADAAQRGDEGAKTLQEVRAAYAVIGRALSLDPLPGQPDAPHEKAPRGGGTGRPAVKRLQRAK